MSTLQTVFTLGANLHTHLAAAVPSPIAPSALPTALPNITPVSSAVASPVAGTSTRTATGTGVLNLPSLVLTIFVWSTLVGALIVSFLPSRNGEDDARIRNTGLAVVGLTLLMAFFITSAEIGASDLGSGTALDANLNIFEQHNWLTSFPLIGSYHLDVDGISVPFMLLSCAIFSAAMLLTWRRGERVKETVALLLVLETGVNGAICARDYILLLIFFGMQLLPLYLLIRAPSTSVTAVPARERAAHRYLSFNLVALLMFAVGGLLAATQATVPLSHGVGTPSNPTFDITNVNVQTFTTPVSIAGFALMFTAFLIMSGGFPFHRWLINAAGDADAGTSALLLGIINRLGGYAILHIALVAFPTVAVKYSSVIVALAVVTTLWGAFAAVVESDMRRMIAYVAMTQTGALLLGVAGVNEVSIVGAVIVMIAGALSTAVLVLIAAAVEERTKHRDIHRLGGLAAQMPRLAGFWIVASLSAIGVPLFAGFTADLLVFTGSFPAHRFATVAVLVGGGMAGAALLWNCQRIFFGPAREIFARVKDGTPLEFTYLAPPIVLMFLYGVLPGRIMSVIATGVNAIVASRLVGP